MIFDYKNFDVDRLCEELQEQNLPSIIENNEVDDAAKMLSDILLEKAKACIPTKTITIKERDSVWITEQIRKLIKDKNTSHKTARRVNTEVAWRNYRQVRNRLTAEIRNRKLEYFKELDDNISNNQNIGTKQWWKIVKTFMSKKGINVGTIPPLVHDNKTYHLDKEKAHLLNDCFTKQASIHNTGTNNVIPPIRRRLSELNEIILNNHEVEITLKDLDGNTAPGPDLISNKILKASASVICKPLTTLFNRCLREGKFPYVWKTAHINPLFKKGNREQCTNYRPISLLSCIGKVLEKCIHRHIMTYLKAHNILTLSQSGFIPGDSTTNQLLSIYNDFCSSLDQGISTQAVFFDISKAFDRVWHAGLLAKLEGVGIRGSLLEFLKSYLTNRTQATVVKGAISDYQVTTAGVPQGSVLGPILFNIYINDIQENIHSTMKLFADDTSMYLSIADPLARSEILNRDLNRIHQWAVAWKVTFNREKTELLNLTRKRNEQFLPLKFCNETLHESPHHKHLGIILQGNCKWDKHIAYLLSKCNTLVNCLRSLKHRLSRKSLEHLYKSFILPHFDYADVLWDNCTETDQDKLENLQLDALRTIVGSVRGTSHQKLYLESGFIPLKERRKRHKLILYHKIVHNKCPEYLKQLLPPLVSDNNPYHLRYPYRRTIPIHDSELYKSSFFISTTLLWNELAEITQKTTSISLFKKLLSENDVQVPPFRYIGKREAQINHCRLRLGMSNLQYDLFKRHLAVSPLCSCGGGPETAKHFLLTCPLYNTQRNATLHHHIPHINNVDILLNGDLNASIEDNYLIVNTVHQYLNISKRFEVQG